jgi:hypothetical protein
LQNINENINNKIFSSAVDAMTSMRDSPTTFWKKQTSKISAEAMLTNSRDEAEKKFRGPYTPAKFLFKDDNDDYVVDADLKLKTDAPTNHPLVLTQKKVDEIFDKIKKENRHSFNLGTELVSLTQPPFGLYSNIPNMAVLSFAMRKYINELNGTDLGTPVDGTNMRDKIVDVFSSWSSGSSNSKLSSKLNVRFGSKEEKDLKELLIGIFDMKRLSGVPELTSLKNVRWGIVAYCKEKSKLPLWCLKYSSVVATEDFKSLIEQLVELSQNNELKEDVVKKALGTVKQHRYELTRILLNTTAFEEGFKTFVQNIKDVTIKDEWWEELKTYLNQQMQDETGWWKESDVETAILRFSIKKNEKDEVRNVIISPNHTSAEKSKTQQFYANVEITGNATKDVTWTVEGGSTSNIDTFGVLKIDANEISTNLTVKATSKFDSSKIGTATVSITSPVSEDKVQKAKNKVAKASNTSPNILKNVLLKILEKFPQVADIIDKNLDE